MVGLVMGPTQLGDTVRISETRQGGGNSRADSPSPGRAPSSSLLPRTTCPPRHGHPKGSRTREEPVSPETEMGVILAPTPPHETHETPTGRDKAPVGEPLVLAQDGPR